MFLSKIQVFILAAGTILCGISPKIYGQRKADSLRQLDVIDIYNHTLHKQRDSDERRVPHKVIPALLPSLGYTLSTGFAAVLAGNIAFHTTGSHAENLSIIETDLAYDTRAQRMFVVQSVLWSADNEYKLVSDVRWERFPESTFGLGTNAGPRKENALDFNYLKFYQTAFKKLGSDYYFGLGYKLDYHYKISASGNKDSSVSDFSRYGQTSTSSSSGVCADLLYDDRKNPINPIDALYADLSYRVNDFSKNGLSNWSSVQLDIRKYIRLSGQSQNVLALWGMAWFTSGRVPYLDLPFTAGDAFNNSGRGYAEARFRGKDMLYVESEYRFNISRNGLLGAVVFANAQSFSEFNRNRFSTIAPAIGSGIRLKLNKHSRTNICVDYAAGIFGSNGLFVNLGEVF